MRFVSALALLLLPIAIQAQKPAELADRIERAAEASSLDVDNLKPWHLKMTVQLFDLKGKPTEEGTIEEFFLRPGTQRIIYNLPSYSATELVSNASSTASTATQRPQ